MTKAHDYVQDTDQLLGLVRAVINQLISEDNKEEKRAMESQLIEIARAIENLEKKDVFIPEVLRAEKTRLAAAVEVQSEAALYLNHLINELENIVREFKPIVTPERNKQTSKRTGSYRSKTPKTNSTTLRELIIAALRDYGGSAQKSEVHKYIEDKLKDKFLPGDLELRESTRDFVWQNNTNWERAHMKEEGIIKDGSPTGIWELTEEYR